MLPLRAISKDKPRVSMTNFNCTCIAGTCSAADSSWRDHPVTDRARNVRKEHTPWEKSSLQTHIYIACNTTILSKLQWWESLSRHGNAQYSAANRHYRWCWIIRLDRTIKRYSNSWIIGYSQSPLAKRVRGVPLPCSGSPGHKRCHTLWSPTKGSVMSMSGWSLLLYSKPELEHAPQEHLRILIKSFRLSASPSE